MNSLSDLIGEEAVALESGPDEYRAFLEAIGTAEVVLLGGASHGTQEFYRARVAITRRLIAEKGFTALALEADWPDAYRVNQFVRGHGHDREPEDALSDFNHFPAWLWRNTELLEFIRWLRRHNDLQENDRAKAGFYGLDLYSLHRSSEAVVAYLDRIDPAGAAQARCRYEVLDRSGGDSLNEISGLAISPAHEKELLAELVELRSREGRYLQRNGPASLDDYFYAAQNALVVISAEKYYRSMLGSPLAAWNFREQHMFQTLINLQKHLARQHRGRKIVVWAHNSHIGDARASEMCLHGKLNLGQLILDEEEIDAFLVGFTTYAGTVTAACQWDAAPQKEELPSSPAGSYEDLFHQVGYARFFLDLRPDNPATFALRTPRLERAVGIVLNPAAETRTHCLRASLPEQFDAILHFDKTHAVQPLDINPGSWELGEIPQTFPSGF